MSVDTLRTTESIYTMAHTLPNLNIDIDCIRETHNGRIDTQLIWNYLIYYGGCNTHQSKHTHENHNKNNGEAKKYKAGFTIAIKTNHTKFIANIIRINGRIVEIRLKTGKLTKNLAILNTYAP